jgi:hypothetical protein
MRQLGLHQNTFQELNGFDGNENSQWRWRFFIAESGCAISKVHYLKSKNNIVTTGPLNDWKSLFYQRVRWLLKNNSIKAVLKTIGSCCFNGKLMLVIGSRIYLVCANWSCNNFIPTQIFSRRLLIFKTNTFLGQNSLLHFSSLLYPFLVFAWPLFLVWKYEWKGRAFSNSTTWKRNRCCW